MWFSVICIASCFFGVFLFLYGLVSVGKSENGDGLSDGLLILAAGVSLVACSALHRSLPSAMDVYRGKTTLRITYEGGVAVDSVVVFKPLNND